MGSALRQGGCYGRVLALAAGLALVILATTYGQVALNRWNIPFYDAIQRRDLGAFLNQLKVFGVIAGALLVLNVGQTWLDKILSLSLRKGMTRDLIRQWMTDHRAVRLSTAGQIGINPDQRLQEDAGVLADMTTALSIGFVQSGVLLASFVGVLWVLSKDFAMPIGGRDIALPGYMVWAAFLYSGLASLLIRIVGYRLVGLNTEHYAREAEFRTSLMRTNEHLVAISLSQGETREARWIEGRFNYLVENLRDIIGAQIGLKWVSSGYGWLSQVVPIIVAAPMYFTGKISFGGLMMAVGAFNQVIAALRWYMDNFASIAIWRATLYRVMSFRDALEAMDEAHQRASNLVRSTDASGIIMLEGLESPASADGPSASTGARLMDGSARIKPGERVMFNGDRTVNHRSLFLALAGLSDGARGKITLPPATDMLFLEKDAYLPEGKLSEILSYPHAPEKKQLKSMVAALGAVGLERLAGSLQQEARWHKVLEEDERARLIFANILVRQPACLVMEDVLDGLEPETARQLMWALLSSGPRTILFFGHSPIFEEVASPRIIRLERA